MNLITKQICSLLAAAPRSYVRAFRIFMLQMLMLLMAKQLRHNNLSKILIVAPHPDDEALGCGGLISSLVSEGKEVQILFLSSGESAHSACCNVESEVIISIREKSALNAGSVLGIPSSNINFLKLSDGSIPNKYNKAHEDAANKLYQYITAWDPDSIFCPHPLDIMPDHISSAEIVRSAVDKLTHKPTIYYYCIWFWIYAPIHLFMRLDWNRSFYADISEYSEKKQFAIESHLNSGDTAPCGDPWGSKLPNDLLKTTVFKRELFFTDVTNEIFELSWKHYMRHK